MSFLRALPVAAFIAAAFSPVASAQPLPHYDMASMAYGAEAIVLVEEPAYQKDGEYARGQARVVESFKGPFKTGDLVSLAIRFYYSRHINFFAGEEVPPGLALMFLVSREAAPSLEPLPSGIKLINKTGVLGFRQMMNPGPYSPTPVPAEFISLPEGAPYDREALILDLRGALDRATRFQAALESRDFPALSGFIQDCRKRKPEWNRVDDLARLAARAFAQHGDLELGLNVLAANDGGLDRVAFRELRELIALFRTEAGFDFLLAKSATPQSGPAAKVTRKLLDGMLADKYFRPTLRFVPKTLEEKAALLARADRLRKLAASGDAASVKLTIADLEALIYTREPALAGAVLRHAQATLGQRFESHAGKPETRKCVAEYFARVAHPPVWPIMARALCEMQISREEKDAIDELAASLKGSCPRDQAEPLGILLDGLPANYNFPVPYGPEAGLRAIGGDRAVAQVLERVTMNPPRLPDKAIYLVPKIDPAGRPATVAALIRLASDRTFSARDVAMRVMGHYRDPQFDTALLRIARDATDEKSARTLAIEMLGKRGDRHLREPLEALGRDEPILRSSVAYVLGFYQDKASLPLLAAWLDEPGQVAERAAYTMGRITRKYFTSSPAGVEDARRWWKEHGAEQ